MLSLVDLKNKRVAVLAKAIFTTGPQGIVKLSDQFQLACSFVYKDSYKLAMEAVHKGEADAAVVNRLTGARYEREYGLQKSGIVFSPVKIRFGLNKDNAGTPKLVKALDRVINTLLEDGNSIYHRSISKALGGTEPVVVEIVPPWLRLVLSLSSAFILLLLGGTFLLRWKIRQKTSALRKTNQQLQEEVGNQQLAQEKLHKAGAVLNNNQRLLDEVQSLTRLGGWEYDVAANHLTWTRETFRIHEVEDDFDLNDVERAFSFYADEGKEIIATAFAHAVQEGRPYDLELPLLTAKGHHRWVRTMGKAETSAGKVSRVLGMIMDITEARQREAEIVQINEELRAINRIITTTTAVAGVKEILEKVLDEALTLSGLEGGTICMISPENRLVPAAHRQTSEATILDFTTNEVKIGECLCGECARDHKPLILKNRAEVLAFSTHEAQWWENIRYHAAFPLLVGSRCLGVLCVFTRTDRSMSERQLNLLESVSSQIAMAIDNAQLFAERVQRTISLEDKVKERTLDLNKTQEALLNLLDDMSLSKEQLETANEKLQEVDRLKSMFIASMSHELRTPLNSVIGFSSILLNEWIGTLNDEQKKSLTSILHSGKHLLSLINDVIDVSKIEAGIVEVGCDDFILAELLAEVKQTFSKEAQDRQFFLDVPETQLSLHTDKRRLLQCILNLVSNAIKYTEQGGVRVAVRHNEEQGIVTIAVTDTGIGIGVEDQGKLFQAFSRIQSHLTAKVLGIGLGLYLTKKIIVEILRGEISMTSAVGQGSCFTMTIPVRVAG